MPDVIKQDGFILTDRTVCIPDFRPAVPPAPAAPAVEEVQDGSAQEENQEEVLDEKAPEPPQPQWVPALPTREEMEQDYREQLQEVCNQAAQKAYSDALQEKRKDIQSALDEVGARLDEMQKLQSQYLEQYTEELKYMAVDIAQKLILQKIQQDDTILKDLILQAVGNIKNTDWLKVEVSDQLVGLVELLKQELKKPVYEGKVELHPIAAPVDTCRVTTEDGTVVATVSVQADNIKKMFERI